MYLYELIVHVNLIKCGQLLIAIHFYLNVFFREYNLITNRMTRSENMMENNNQIDPRFW